MFSEKVVSFGTPKLKIKKIEKKKNLQIINPSRVKKKYKKEETVVIAYFSFTSLFYLPRVA